MLEIAIHYKLCKISCGEGLIMPDSISTKFRVFCSNLWAGWKADQKAPDARNLMRSEIIERFWHDFWAAQPIGNFKIKFLFRAAYQRSEKNIGNLKTQTQRMGQCRHGALRSFSKLGPYAAGARISPSNCGRKRTIMWWRKVFQCALVAAWLWNPTMTSALRVGVAWGQQVPEGTGICPLLPSCKPSSGEARVMTR